MTKRWLVLLMQVHVDEWRVEVQEGKRFQDLLKQQHDAPPHAKVARSAALIQIFGPSSEHAQHNQGSNCTLLSGLDHVSNTVSAIWYLNGILGRWWHPLS